MEEKWRWRWRWRWCRWKSHSLVALLSLLVFCSQWSAVSAICPSKCVCNDDTLVVICERGNVDVIPITLNPSIKRLIFKNNNIQKVVASFNFYQDLEYLDLTHDKIATVENKVFEFNYNLEVLKLSRNQISRIAENTFAGLRNLTHLYLDENMLEGLPERAFVHLKNLEELDVSSNRLSLVAPGAFEGLPGLRSLRLRDNQLKRVPSASWRPLRALDQLHLGANPFFGLPSDAFRPLAALRDLALDACSVKDVAPDAFQGLQQLRRLRMRDNLLTSVPTHAWDPLVRLEELALGQNHFDEVRANAFAGLGRLQALEINGAIRLVALRSQALTANAGLRRVVMNHNLRFSIIEPGAFGGLSGLRHLSLREDAFRSFGQELLAWDELDTLDIRDNPLECNCSLLWLRTLVAARNLTLETEIGGGTGAAPALLAAAAIRCHSPSPRLLAELTAGDLGCYFPNARQQAMFGIVGAAVVACLLTLVLLVYKFRKRVTSVLKDKWTDGALRRKDLHYEKTNDEEENNILQAAQQSLKMTPVTEL